MTFSILESTIAGRADSRLSKAGMEPSGSSERFSAIGTKQPANLRKWALARMNPTSIFDLSPSEKLQLVEDLWDDLAATPDAVPVHDWQRQELSRRKANLTKNPATGLAWEEVKRRVRATRGR